MAFILWLVCASGLMAQQHPTVDWKVSIAELETRLARLGGEGGPASDAWAADAELLRTSIRDFTAAHPEIRIVLPDPLPPHPSLLDAARQLAALKDAVDAVIKQSPGTPFNLGLVTVNVSASVSAPSPVADSMDQEEIENRNAVNAAKALDLLTGVSIQHIAVNRNEAGIMVRGFSTRGQIPFYLDGIPISVPYDGYIDFNRFLTSGIAEVQVARGYASPLLGPNALGGSINLVTEEPVKKLQADALIGTGSGRQLLSALHLGSHWRHFFILGSLDWLQSDFIPLSGEFTVNQYKNLPDMTMTDRLNQSDSRDEKFSGRIGWTPRASDQYIFSYNNQKGKKGVPLYQGPNTAAVFRNFWRWPYWNMANYYFHSSTGLGENNSVKFRAFYNQFKNGIDMYSDDTYSVMNTKNAEHSIYDDHTDGAAAEFDTRTVSRNAIAASFFFKDDTHRERGIYPGRSPYPLVTPDLVDRAQVASLGVEDKIKVSSRWLATAGFSADHLDGLQGESYNSALTGLVPFTCLASPSNTSFAGCTAHVWNFNPQASASYALGKSGNLFATVADRGRFPMLKDIYSASMGAGLPNPNLEPEHALSWNLGYSRAFGALTVVQGALFRTDLRHAIESVYVTDPGGASPATEYCPSSKIPGYCSEMANIGKEVHGGAELQIRSMLLRRLSLDVSYSYLNRTIAYDFASVPTVSQANTSIMVMPTLPRNKLLASATLRLPRHVLGIIRARYEGGLTLQDTTYATTSPLFRPFPQSFGTADLGIVVPIWKGMVLQTGVANVFDRNYYYTAGFPEEGRNWYFNTRYRF
jgi:iron complex outermembrane receptor protein